jgi:deoxycytidylate deaminase
MPGDPPLTRHDIKALHIAVSTSDKSDHKHKHGAIIYNGRKIVSRGFNSSKTHPLADRRYDYSCLHAELDAIIKARGPVRNSSMAIVRVNNSGKLMNSKPCSYCMKLLKEKGIRYLTYSINGGVKKIRL